MEARPLTPELSVSDQISASDVDAIRAAGFRAIICNRPDGEGADQPNFNEIDQAAKRVGLETRYLPAESGKVTDEEGENFGMFMQALPKPVLAYCRTGTRSTTMWALSQARLRSISEIVETAKSVGYDLSALVRRIANGGKTPVEVAEVCHDIVIIGAGAAGIATAASLLSRDNELDIALIDPADVHYYQPG